MERTILTTYNHEEFENLIDNRISKVLQEELSKLATLNGQSKTIYTRQETAELLNISLPTLNEYTKQGIITAYRLGTKVRYKLEDIYDALRRIATK